MAYDVTVLREAIGYSGNESFTFSQLGYVNTGLKDTLTFLSDQKYADALNINPNIVAVIVSPEIKHIINGQLIKIESIDPTFDFYSLHNYLAKKQYAIHQSHISRSAQIGSGAFISEHNVIIDENVVIEPNVVILPDVHIGPNCVIRAGAVIGSEGFEFKRTSKGLLPVFHDGRVLIGEGVEIGANTTVDKGIFGKDTKIGNFTKIDNLVQIAHNVNVGRNCLLVSNCCVLGSVTIGDDVWIGPSTTLINGCSIGDRAEITMGTIVTKNVESDVRVVGKLGFSKLMTF